MPEATPWYEWDPDKTDLDDHRDRKMLACPILSPVEVEQLRQLRSATWDGNLISKSARDSLHQKGLVSKYEGWQVITREGLAVLHTLGGLNA